jgi:hypothetical protein
MAAFCTIAFRIVQESATQELMGALQTAAEKLGIEIKGINDVSEKSIAHTSSTQHKTGCLVPNTSTPPSSSQACLCKSGAREEHKLEQYTGQVICVNWCFFMQPIPLLRRPL